MDTLTPQERSAVMSRIRSTGTRPEKYVARLLKTAGYKCRLHSKRLPGTPDIALVDFKIAVEVRGCFWHLHRGCAAGRIPHSRHAWWKVKLERNARRDANNLRAMARLGWKTLVVWECLVRRAEGDNAARVAAVILDAVPRLVTSKRWHLKLGADALPSKNHAYPALPPDTLAVAETAADYSTI